MLRQVTFPVGPLACNCTVLTDDGLRTAVVIDPGAEIERVLELLGDRKLEAILVTHAHIDHIGGAAELKRRTGAPVWLSPRDLPLYAELESQAGWLGVPTPSRTAIDGDLVAGARLRLGGEPLQVLETPGHTPGSVSLYLPGEGKLFAGDTLFAGSIGRTDFPGGNHAQLLASIRERLWPMGDDTVFIPGHGPESTFGAERRGNPYVGDR